MTIDSICAELLQREESGNPTKLAAFDTFITFIQLIHDHREHTIQQLKVLEQVIGGLKRIKQVQDVHCKIFHWWIETALKLIWADGIDIKVHRKIIRLERLFGEEVYRELEGFLKHLKCSYDESTDQLAVWSQLLEVSRGARKHASEKFTVVLAELSRGMQTLLDADDLCMVHRQQQLHVLIKVTLQLTQHLPDVMYSDIWGDGDAGNTITTHIGCVCHHRSSHTVLCHLLQVLNIQVLPKDCLLLAGTAVSFLLCLCKDTRQTVYLFIQIFHNLGIREFDCRNLERNIVQETEKTDVSVQCLSFSHISLISGLLSCVNSPLLCQLVPDHSHGALNMWLFDVIFDLCTSSDHQFHAFSTLKLWFHHMGTRLADMVGEVLKFCCDGHVVKRTLQLVWTHVDSPVDGVNECVIDVLKGLIKLQQDEVGLKREDGAEMEVDQGSIVALILPQVVTLPWNVRGKYSLLTVLLLHLDLDQFLKENTEVFEQLLKCLSTNYLAPSATTLYRAIVQQLREGGSTRWQTWCMPWVIKALASENNLLRHNVSQYWLPWTLQMVPRSFDALLMVMQPEGGCTIKKHQRALIALYKVQRAQQLLKDWPDQFIAQCLLHSDNDIRQDAFSLVCISPKKAVALTDSEMLLLKQGLPYNMNVDSAPFRQLLRTCLRQALERGRDGALARLKAVQHRQASHPLDVLSFIEFVDWLWGLCVSNLRPSSNFQCFKTSLDWAATILDTLIYQPGRQQRKGGCPETVKELVAISESTGHWRFFTSDHSHNFLTCILSGTDEVRETAARILLKFFPWPLPLGDADDLASGDHVQANQTALCWLLSHSLALSNSPKSQESKSGALICRMIFEKCVVEHSDHFHVTFMKETGHFEVKCTDTERVTDSPAVKFLACLIEHLEASLQLAQINVLCAAKQAPAHGFLLAIHRCLAEGNLKFESHNKWQPIIVRLLDVIRRLIDVVLYTLGGKIHDQEGVAPSFEQISIAVQSVIAEGSVDDSGPGDDVRDTVLSSEHQLVMMWCWLNIRECSILLGCLVEMVPIQVKDELTRWILSLDQVVDMGNTMLRVLTTCRHRGAIESCSIGFTRYCTYLLGCAQPRLYKIPRQLLRQLLDQMTSKAVVSSVTRRSAGLPLVIQSIVVSESKTKQSSLLTEAMTYLLDIVQRPVPCDEYGKFDVPQVHAMHVLKALFRESCVALAVTPHISSAVVQAIDGFSSPLWSVRNAATQLFGTLVSRMLGQNKSRHAELNTTTAPEFFARFPDLQAELLKLVQGVTMTTGSQSGGTLQLHASLFPVLSILGKLNTGAASEEDARVIKQFHEPLLCLGACPMYAVRILAAQALAALTPQQLGFPSAHWLISQLPFATTPRIDFNLLHGRLLQLEKLLHSLTARPASDQSLVTLVDGLLTRSWLATQSNPCHMVRAKYINLLTWLSGLTIGLTLPDDMVSCLDLQCGQLVETSANSQQTQVAVCLYEQALVRWWLQTPSSSHLAGRIGQCLESDHGEVKLATTACLQEWLDSGQQRLDMQGWHHVQVCLFCLLLTEPHRKMLEDALQLILDIHHLHGVSLPKSNEGHVWQVLMELIEKEADSSTAALSIAVSAVLMKGCTSNSMIREQQECWWAQLQRASSPTQTVLTRLSAAKALHLAGPGLVQQNVGANLQHWQAMLICLLRTAVDLLVDEDTEVRQVAALFVRQVACDQQFPGIQNQAVHNSYALELLSDVLVHIVGDSTLPESLLQWLIGSLRPMTSLTEVISKATSQQTDELFNLDDVNPYKEKPVIDKWMLKCLLRLVSSGDDTRQSVEVDECCGRLEEAVSLLQTMTHMDRPLNVTCHIKVYNYLHGLLCHAQLVTFCCHGNTSQRCLVSLKEVGQMACLHPSLKQLVSQAMAKPQQH
ncbi:Thyroid adenoma-associated protein [Lamellibrachia satsuma]|nr:Thyroid adenoma-associated protein [Lamellibrachia satsuma]